MDDLDQLQMDLESLLSKVAVRQRLLQSEILSINNSDSSTDRGKAVRVFYWYAAPLQYFLSIYKLFFLVQASPGKKGRSRGSKLVENLTKTRDVARSSSSKHSKKLYRMAPLAGSVPVSMPYLHLNNSI